MAPLLALQKERPKGCTLVQPTAMRSVQQLEHRLEPQMEMLLVSMWVQQTELQLDRQLGSELVLLSEKQREQSDNSSEPRLVMQLELLGHA